MCTLGESVKETFLALALDTIELKYDGFVKGWHRHISDLKYVAHVLMAAWPGGAA